MDAQLDLQQLPRSTARRVDPTQPAVLSTEPAPRSAGTASIIRGARRDALDVAPPDRYRHPGRKTHVPDA
ncbi:UNVERIFIED_CONTAM: hypothetical protein RF648_04710 [Kocuria sp. CPCC 205274]